MNIFYSLVIVLALSFLAILGAQAGGFQVVFGVVVPYVAIVLFFGGIIYRVISWAKVPVPFRIPTTCGQQKSLPWIKANNLENPSNTAGVIGRMLLEVLFFRSLFRNTRTELHEGPKVVYGSTKWLWLSALVFHYSFLIILLRHLRFFTEPVPWLVKILQDLDGFLQIGVPVMYLTSILLLAAVLFLLLRRMLSPSLNYISLVNDYFPLFLILAIGTTGVLLRHFVKTDIIGIKELAMGLISASPAVPEGIHYLFFTHFFLVCVLFAYFPFSKLTHMAGVFMSPTRNLANTNRAERHINPWNYPVEVHTYEEYEDEFREKMKQVGLPLDKE